MLFSKPAASSVALIDIHSSSVGAALVRLEEGKAPALCYTVRIPIEGSENLTAAMLRSLEEVGNRLVREGAPALRSVVGDGRIDKVLVSFGSPWQEASVETKKVQKEAPFTFTKSFAVDLLKPVEGAPGKNVTHTVIATLLNGYHTPEPYGKEAKRAEIIVLSTSLDEGVIESVRKVLRSTFHTHDIRYTSFLEPAYRAIQTLYPHEKDFLLMCVSGGATEVISVKRGYLLDAGAVSCGSRAFNTTQGCVTSLSDLLREFAGRHALPRTIFILADNAETLLKEALNDPSLHALWLSDTPLSALPVQASQFSGMVATKGSAEGDSRLAMLALMAQGS